MPYTLKTHWSHLVNKAKCPPPSSSVMSMVLNHLDLVIAFLLTKSRFLYRRRACTEVLFLRKAELRFFHFLEIVTGWLTFRWSEDPSTLRVQFSAAGSSWAGRWGWRRFATLYHELEVAASVFDHMKASWLTVFQAAASKLLRLPCASTCSVTTMIRTVFHLVGRVWQNLSAAHTRTFCTGTIFFHCV